MRSSIRHRRCQLYLKIKIKIKLVPQNLKLEKIMLIRSMNFNVYSQCYGASLTAQLVKNLPATQETLVQFLGQEDPLEKG